MPLRFLIVTAMCISLCFAAIASAQNGRFFNSRRYVPSNPYSAPIRQAPRLTEEQLNRIYGPSILVRNKKKSAQPATSFVVQPR